MDFTPILQCMHNPTNPVRTNGQEEQERGSNNPHSSSILPTSSHIEMQTTIPNPHAIYSQCKNRRPASYRTRSTGRAARSPIATRFTIQTRSSILMQSNRNAGTDGPPYIEQGRARRAARSPIASRFEISTQSAIPVQSKCNLGTHCNPQTSETPKSHIPSTQKHRVQEILADSRNPGRRNGGRTIGTGIAKRSRHPTPYSKVITQSKRNPVTSWETK